MINPSDTATADKSSWSDVVFRIKARAIPADRGEISLAADLADLHRTAFLNRLVCDASEAPLQAATFFRRLGRASLPVGRIVEGHVNALKLIGLYGSAKQRCVANAKAAAGIIFGVWGADGVPAANIATADLSTVTMTGQKRFCSGLGLVGQAVLSVDGGDGVQLLLADVTDVTRADATDWQVSGMRATASGSYNFEGVRAEYLGNRGDYLIEPYFEGGIWRYCALHTGGLEAIAEFVRQHLQGRDDPHQSHRLAQLVLLADGARLQVEAAAVAIESGAGIRASVTRALLAREAVEMACLAGISIAERALGTQAFRAGTAVDLCVRDLRFFLRQANLDGKLNQAARSIQAMPSEVGEQW